jgi:uncharacterized protein YndB with AHSA1/START domain
MTRTDRASLLLHVDRPRVFAALTQSAALLQWLPPTGMRGRFEHFDMRPGGSYRLVLTYDDATASPGKSSDNTDVAVVRILDVDEDLGVSQEVAFESKDEAFSGTMQMRWTMTSEPEGTLVELEARNVPAGISARDHAAGLTSSLVQLAAHLEP